MRKRATIADVARQAGVSPTAVSFAFNNPGQLNPVTVDRIRSAARLLGYAPNPHARALNARRAGVLGVLVPQSLVAIYANPFFPAFLQGVGSLCDDQGLALLTASPLNGSLGDAIARAPVDGFIILGLDEQHVDVMPLLRRQVPFVIVDGRARTVPSVTVDDEGGAYAAAAHLLARGHRQPLIFALERPFAAADQGEGTASQRLRGYQRAFAEFDQPWNPERLLPSLSSVEDGAASFAAAWAAGLRPTAVLAMSDAMAIGIVQEARRLALRLPEDLEIIGFDDIPIAALLTPPLSTVRQPIVEKGRTAAELLLALIEGAAAPASVRLPTELVPRGTTR